METVSKNFYSSATHRIDAFIRKDVEMSKVAITFTPGGTRQLEGLGFGGPFLQTAGFDLVAFKSTVVGGWRQVPLPVFMAISAFLKSKGYQRRVGYGSSFGASGALGVSGVLDLDTVLAFSPLVAFDLAGDPRFTWQARHMPSAISSLEELLRPQCQYFVIYDPTHLDALHARRLQSMLRPDQFHAVELRHSGHQSLNMVVEYGALSTLVLGVLNHDQLPSLGWRRGKAKSKSYLKHLAMVALNHSRTQLALSLIDRAVGLDLKDPAARWVKVDMLKRMGRADDAAATWESLLKCAGAVEQFMSLGHELQRLGLPAEALPIAEIACTLDRKLATAHQLRSWALERLGRPGEAIEAGRTALDLHPNDVTSATALAWLLFRNGDNNAAHEVFREAIALTGESSALMGGLAQSLFALGRVDEAMEAANKAAQRWPDDAVLQASVKQLGLRLKQQTASPAAPQAQDSR